MSCSVAIPMPITTDPLSFGFLIEGLRQLNTAIEEIKEYRDSKGHACEVDFVFKTKNGDAIGVKKDGENVNFVVNHPEKESVKETIKQVKQVYARLKIIHQVKSKGYKQVKEEKLADGSIRLVVQKWR